MKSLDCTDVFIAVARSDSALMMFVWIVFEWISDDFNTSLLILLDKNVPACVILETERLLICADVTDSIILDKLVAFTLVLTVAVTVRDDIDAVFAFNVPSTLTLNSW